jgi:hypothetical protein
MGPHRKPGPVGQAKERHDDVEDGTLARTASPHPSPVGSKPPADAPKARTRTVATGACSYLNPQSRGTVIASPEAFDKLRTKSGAATISPPEAKSAYTWPDKSTSQAVEQEIQIDGQKIRIVRPTDDNVKGKNLPTTKQLAEALRAIPKDQRSHTNVIVVSPTPAPGTDATQTIAGQGGSGTIELFPVNAAQSQNDFDNRLTHESGHNYQETFWTGAGDVHDWQNTADQDDRRPSPYAASTTGDDFSEFNVLYNAAKGTPCEATAKKIYPHRWEKLEDYRSK